MAQEENLPRTAVREQIWKKLREVALPDSRFHLNFAEYIPDFEGSDQALRRLVATSIYQNSRLIFITPDNCLEGLRIQALLDHKCQVVPTYGIRRGMVLLQRDRVPIGQEEFGSTLDGLERFGEHVTLAQIQQMRKIDFLITGASAISINGIRYGKGHGFFDLEWAMMREIGVVDENTTVIALVHDVQVMNEELEARPFDTLADLIVTPSQIISVTTTYPKPGGILWELLEPGMIEDIPPLKELQNMKLAP